MQHHKSIFLSVCEDMQQLISTFLPLVKVALTQSYNITIMAVVWSGGLLTPGRLSTQRPMAPPTLVRSVRRGNSGKGPQTIYATSWDWDCAYSSHRRPFAITRPTENTCGNVCASTSWGWDCAYSSHRRPFVITRPIENLLCVGRSL